MGYINQFVNGSVSEKIEPIINAIISTGVVDVVKVTESGGAHRYSITPKNGSKEYSFFIQYYDNGPGEFYIQFPGIGEFRISNTTAGITYIVAYNEKNMILSVTGGSLVGIASVLGCSPVTLDAVQKYTFALKSQYTNGFFADIAFTSQTNAVNASLSMYSYNDLSFESDELVLIKPLLIHGAYQTGCTLYECYQYPTTFPITLFEIATINGKTYCPIEVPGYKVLMKI